MGSTSYPLTSDRMDSARGRIDLELHLASFLGGENIPKVVEIVIGCLSDAEEVELLGRESKILG